MRCEIVSFVVQVDPRYAGGASRACHQCNTHLMYDIGVMDETNLCPVGKVEKAVEDGLARIEAALAKGIS